MLRFNCKAEPESWRLEINIDPADLAQVRGSRYLEKNADLTLPICLDNGTYDRENISRLLKFAREFSNKITIFTTDGPAVHNYKAIDTALQIGDPTIKVKERIGKARLNGNRLRNLCLNGLRQIDKSTQTDDKEKRIEFLSWENIYEDERYKDAYGYLLLELYQGNDAFKTDINGSSRTYITRHLEMKLKQEKYDKNKLHDRDELEKAVEKVLPIAVQYPLEELAMLMCYHDLSPQAKPIADHGGRGFNYLYIDRWPVFEKLISGDYDGKPSEKIGFVVANIVDLNRATSRRRRLGLS